MSKDYRGEAERVRELAGQMGRGDMRELALEIAEFYDKMARQAEILAVLDGADAGNAAVAYEKLVQRLL